MTGCYFGRTPLSPLLKVVLLHGSKLINLSNVGLSRWHYPDSYIYWHVFAVILSDLRNVIHTPQGRGEDFPSHQLHFFFLLQTNSIFSPSSVLATSTFKLKFSDDCTLFKIQFYHKVTWYKSGGKVHSEHTLFLIFSLTQGQGQHPELQTFCFIQHSWSHILCTQ